MSELRPKSLDFRGPGPSRLVVALDQPAVQSRIWVERLSSEVWGFKVGSVLFTEMGPSIVKEIKDKGSRVFLDLKWHDIPNTVFEATQRAFDLGVDWVTIHASGGPKMIQKLLPLENADQKILAVTALTSFSDEDLSELGLRFDKAADWAEHLFKMAHQEGLRHFVCSAQELENLDLARRFPEAQFVCPGIRLAGQGAQDQSRVATPEIAFSAGASYLVMGRALTGDERNWKEIWENLKSSLAAIHS